MKILRFTKSNCPALLLAGLGGLLAAVNIASAQTWTPATAPPQDWQTIASSADGVKLVAAGFQSYDAGLGSVYAFPSPIYLSSDSGATWRQTQALTGYWRSVACSADGTKLVAADGGGNPLDQWLFPHPRGYGSIYVSTNSGGAWTLTGAPSNSWTSVASSADGTKLIAAAYATYDTNDMMIGTLIYTSADSGLTWTTDTAPSNSWSCVASSADGVKLVAASYATHDTNGMTIGNLIYTSTNSGATWTPTGALSNSWSSVASSADGTRLVATSGSDVFPEALGDGLIYTSTNSGTTWTPSSAPSVNHWVSVASSTDGTKLVAAGYASGYFFSPTTNLVYASTNAGATWTQAGFPINSWISISSVASSADGAKIVGAGDRLYVSSYQGPWKLADAPTEPWTSVASSADGTKLVATASPNSSSTHLLKSVLGDGLIYTSTNSGATWTPAAAPTNNWNVVAISSDGARIVAVAGVLHQGSIYTSIDTGGTWTPTSAPSYDWTSVASSADGTKLVAASLYDSLIYTSPDSGASWKRAISTVDFYYTSVASSANGSKLVAASLGSIYSSADMGVTWSPLTGAPIPIRAWLSVASSADGTKLVACTDADYDSPDSLIYTSADSGATWTRTKAPSNYWSSVTCSADGTVLAACAGLLKEPEFFWEGGGGVEAVYLSTNSGVTWEDSRAPGEAWTSLAISANGKRLVAVSELDSCIYTLQLPVPPPPPFPSPHLDVNASGGSMGISWPVPSTSFALQQNDDLTTTNWTDVPMSPTLNFTTVNYQVMVPPHPGSHFYRLRSP